MDAPSLGTFLRSTSNSSVSWPSGLISRGADPTRLWNSVFASLHQPFFCKHKWRNKISATNANKEEWYSVSHGISNVFHLALLSRKGPGPWENIWWPEEQRYAGPRSRWDQLFWDVRSQPSVSTHFCLLWNSCWTEAKQENKMVAQNDALTCEKIISQHSWVSIVNTCLKEKADWQFNTRPCSPQYADASGEAIVHEEDPYTGQLVDPAELHRLRTSMLLQLHNGSPAPEACGPLCEDHGALVGAVEWKHSNRVQPR